MAVKDHRSRVLLQGCFSFYAAALAFTGAGNIPWSQLQYVVSTQALADHSNPFARDKPQVNERI